MDEIATGAPTWVQPATSGEVELFKTTVAGKMLADMWKGDAPELVGTLRARARRLNDVLGDDAADLWEWLDSLPSPVVIKIFSKMAG
jgi:hypothetical protein